MVQRTTRLHIAFKDLVSQWSAPTSHFSNTSCMILVKKSKKTNPKNSLLTWVKRDLHMTSLLSDVLRLQHKIAEKQLDLIRFYFEKCVRSVWVLDYVNRQNDKLNPIFILNYHSSVHWWSEIVAYWAEKKNLKAILIWSKGLIDKRCVTIMCHS